ncbi:MAG: hypothetical protein FIB08_17205 [Candidatus Methanoperedens sp.]|nr:hypothetical protein [Candidatus Methanoperedens sp.]
MGEICCSPSGPRITKVRIGSVEVGLVALGDIFEKLHGSGRKPEDLDGHELVQEVSIYNYIPSAAWDEYARTLKEEYKKYCSSK